MRGKFTSMKAIERRHLKQNDFAATVKRATDYFQANRDQITVTALIIAVVVLGAGGYYFWKQRTNDHASEMFGLAMAITEAQIAPASTLPGAAQAPGTYPTERARLEAAVIAFQAVATAYPSTDSGTAAKYQAAAALLSLDRLAEAEQGFRDVAASSSMYGPLAKLGLAGTYAAEKQYDKAIQVYNDLAAQRGGALPVDGILMQLGQTYLRAGRSQDARVAFKRVVDEFPDSLYAAAAKTELAQISAP
jgi:TolA-binding protein